MQYWLFIVPLGIINANNTSIMTKEEDEKVIRLVQITEHFDDRVVTYENIEDHSFFVPYASELDEKREVKSLTCPLWIYKNEKDIIHVSTKKKAILSLIYAVISYEDKYDKLIDEYNALAKALEAALQELEDNGIKSKYLASEQAKENGSTTNI